MRRASTVLLAILGAATFVLGACCSDDDDAPGVSPTSTGIPTSATAADVRFPSCADAEAADATSLHAGDPGYSTDLDRDGDGVACEKGATRGPGRWGSKSARPNRTDRFGRQESLPPRRDPPDGC
jgi:hypothetical protein